MTADAQEVTIWSATLTPQRNVFGPTITGYGYFPGSAGSLSDTDFVYRGTTYTISRLATIQHSATWQTELFMTPGLPECDQAIGRFYSNNTNYTGSGQDPLVSLSSSPRPPWDNGANASVYITVAPVAPDAPTNLAQIVNGTQAMLFWDTSCDGGSDVTRHEYRLEEVGEASFGDWTSIPISAPTEANANSYTVPSLDSTKTYVFEVRAVNAKGEGPSSNPSRTDSLDGTVCTRTAQVRDAIVAATSKMSCGDVTVGDLAAITQLRPLRSPRISSLTEGDFDGLTALTTLILNNNGLTTLPAGVFEPLTSLTDLRLVGNPGAPFAPEAVALPDDGTVSIAGGTVTLDGSGSDGGPWGTNVTYSWRQTSGPTSGVRFDDTTIATPEVTIPALTAGTELTFTLTVTGRGGTNGIDAATDTATVTAFDPTAGICGRTAAVRNAILGRIGGVDNCADVTATQLARITTTLSLSSQSITALAAGDFDGLTSLEYLVLADNGLTTLPAGVFDELTALMTLGLTSNELTTLPTGVFAGLTSLEYLGLSLNALTTLPAGVFDELTALTRLNLDRNDLTELPAGVFDNLTALTELRLNDNELIELPDGVFDNLTALTTLRLYYNALTTLPAGVFDGLTSLQYLNLAINALTTLPTGVFDELTSLTTLSLAGNPLTPLPAGVFAGLTSLESLGLFASPLLTTLRAGVFDGLTALTNLNLRDNSLSTLPAGVFAGLTSLTTLELHNNALTTLPAGVFDELTALTRLTLSTNALTDLPAGVFETLTALTQLILWGNPGAPFAPEADALPDDGTVSNAGGTVTLDGSGSDGGPWGTNVTYSWRQTSGPTSGVTFDDAASATPVVTIPALAAGTELTFTLTVTGRGGTIGIAPGTDTAKVTVFGGICGRTAAVQTEILSNISAVSDCALVTATHLASVTTSLQLRTMDITALAAGDFAGLTGVWYVNLSGNELTTLPAGVFDELTALTRLSLDRNDLTELPAGVFDNLTALTELRLYDNELIELPDGVFDNLTALTELRLYDNELIELPDGVFERR